MHLNGVQIQFCKVRLWGDWKKNLSLAEDIRKIQKLLLSLPYKQMKISTEPVQNIANTSLGVRKPAVSDTTF